MHVRTFLQLARQHALLNQVPEFAEMVAQGLFLEGHKTDLHRRQTLRDTAANPGDTLH
jgi:hypothetical protein